VGPVTALAGVCLQDVEGAHEGGKRLLASRPRPVSSEATHPPTYLPLHSPHPRLPPPVAHGDWHQLADHVHSLTNRKGM